MNKTVERYPDVLEGTPTVLSNYIKVADKKPSEKKLKASEKLRKDILKRVNAAIKELYDSDVQLLKEKMNEVTITGRLSFYLNKQFEDYKGYFIDIEYYRLKVPKEKTTDVRKDRIRCDILLHSRRKYCDEADNLLAMEVKLVKNIDDGSSDKYRLMEFLEPKFEDTPEDAIHSTLLGIFLRLCDDKYLMEKMKVVNCNSTKGFEINIEKEDKQIRRK